VLQVAGRLPGGPQADRIPGALENARLGHRGHGEQRALGEQLLAQLHAQRSDALALGNGGDQRLHALDFGLHRSGLAARDGDDEFLIGLRGPEPWQGVIYYKAVDLERGLFLKWKVAEESTARIVAADFAGTGVDDFATISYSVEHYFVAPEAKITLHPNKIKESHDNA